MVASAWRSDKPAYCGGNGLTAPQLQLFHASMGQEIERKFLVVGTPWQEWPPGMEIRQGYLSLDPARSVRVRIAGEQAWLTIKGLTRGWRRAEFEFAIPATDAGEMLASLATGALVEKTRYTVGHEGHRWDVDVFRGENAGLAVAEIELESEDESFAMPPWLGAEVSDDPRYFNLSLAKLPWHRWE